MIAEESTSFAGITHDPQWGGLGFDWKWDMGLMNDTLSYIEKDPIHRKHHQNDLTFSQLYAYTEKFMNVLSHDEVVHGKKSLLAKMPGDVWQQFANMRTLYSYMICQPGKKLFFMGVELGMWDEWSCKKSLPWNLLTYPIHAGLNQMIKDLNHLYLHERALFERDTSPEGFEWISFSDHDNSVISYLRKSEHSIVFCIHNFTPNSCNNYFVPLKNIETIELVFNSDNIAYGGSGKGSYQPTLHYHNGAVCGVELELAPLSTQIFSVSFRGF